MPELTDVSAASSTATEQAQTLAPESWTDAQRSEWLKTGEQPKPEASAPSKPQDTSSAGDKPAEPGSDSEPGQNNGEERKPRRSDANKRIRELLDENRSLRQRLDGQQPAKPAGEKPAEKPAEAPSKPSTEQPSADTSGRPKKPVQEDFNSYREYEEALDKYQEDLTDWKIEQRDRKRTEEQQQKQQRDAQETAHATFMERVEASKKNHADYDAVIEAAEHVQASPAMVQFIMDSELGGELSYFLAKNLERFEQIAEMSPVRAIRELTKIETELAGSSKPAAAAPTPKPKPTTSASKPPTELNGRATAPEDEAAQALKDGDFARYQRIMNARDAKK